MSHVNITAETFSIIKDATTTAALLLGGVGAYLALSRQLKLNSVSDLLKGEALAKNELQAELQKQLSYVSTAFSRYPPLITTGELNDLIAKAQTIEGLSSALRSEVANVSMLLRLTMQRVLRYYTSQSSATPSSNIAWFYETSLHLLSGLNVKIITFPSLFSLFRYSRKERFFERDLVRYGRDNRYKVLTFAQFGILLDPLRSEIIDLYETARQSGDIILMKSICRVLSTVLPLSRSLFANKIYVPVVLDSAMASLGSGSMPFLLIGFRHMTSIGPNPVETIHSYYMPADDRLSLTAANLQSIKTERDLYFETHVGMSPRSVSLDESSIVQVDYLKHDAERAFHKLKPAMIRRFQRERRMAQPWKR